MNNRHRKMDLFGYTMLFCTSTLIAIYGFNGDTEARVMAFLALALLWGASFNGGSK